MAAATITQTDWGYSVTGGTDATLITKEKLYVKRIAFSGNADNATALLTTYARKNSEGAISAGKFKSSDTGELNSAMGNEMFFGDKGVPMPGLTITLSNTSDHIYIFTK